MPDAELCEWLLVWSIRDDMIIERTDRYSGREPAQSITRREKLLNDWLIAVARRERERREDAR